MFYVCDVAIEQSEGLYVVVLENQTEGTTQGRVYFPEFDCTTDVAWVSLEKIDPFPSPPFSWYMDALSTLFREVEEAEEPDQQAYERAVWFALKRAIPFCIKAGGMVVER